MKNQKSRKTALLVLLGVGLFVGAFTTSPDEVSGPQVQLSETSPVYIPPAASPGEQDMFRSPVAADAPDDAVIAAYEVRVSDENGETIYRFAASADDAAVEEMRASGLKRLLTP